MAALGQAEEERYRGLVNGAKAAAGSGELEEALRLFRLAAAIRPSEKLRGRMQRVEEALAAAEQQEEEEEGFVDVCGSGLLIYGEMHGKLFQHQRDGVAFLYRLHREGRPGGILADDMGLGKTIQVIAFLSGMFDAELIRHVLLIMPTTLVSSWLAEFARWTPGLRVKEFHGTSKSERTRNLERVQRKNGIVITSYQMLINNWKQLASSYEQEFVWDYVILDEAHKIKCPSNKTTKCVYAIPAKHRLLLTGTPVQNNLREMWSLFDFACQGSLLGTAKTFKMEYENPITRAREKDATLGEKALGLKISENLMTIIKPYFLRRTKDDIKNNRADKPDAPLPEDPSENSAPIMPSLTRKNDFVVWVYLAPVQEEIYRSFLSLDHVKEVLMTTRSPLAELTVLKKLCDHPRLLSARACIQLGLEEQEYSEQDHGTEAGTLSCANKIDHLSDETLIQESGKMLFLIGLLERLREEGHRTLVFSQSRKMLDIIERVLSRRHFKIMRIDGTVTHLTEREKRINAFQCNKDYSIFLLTTQVGGVGITLTAASRVVIFDPSWNPATDAQAVDRAYRIGQKENVVIYRLITCGTVEEKIYRRQVFKDSLIRQTTGDKKNPFRYFSKQELRELFTLEDTRTSATQIQLQSLHATQRKTDLQLDEHIAYLHSLEMFGISDHDLIYTREIAHEEQVESEEAHQYIQRRVQKAHELVQLESQLRDQRMEGIRNACEEKWQRPPELVSEPKKLSPGLNNINHFVSPPVADKHENDKVIDLTEDKEVQVLNVSSKMTNLTNDDLDEEKLAQDVSRMDTELLNTSKTGKQSNIQESEQNLESSVIPSSPGLHPLDKESQSLKHKQCSHVNSDSLTEAGNGLSGQRQHSSNDSCVADDPNSLRDAEMSDQVLDPHAALGTDTNDVPELALAAAVPSLSNVTPEIHAGLQKSHVLEASLEDMCVPSLQDQVDFNLVLEESEDGWQDASNRERSLEHPEKEGFQLKAESFCKSPTKKSPTKTWLSENSNCRKPCHAAEEEPNNSLQGSDASDESSGAFVFGRKKCLNRIVSDSEDEDHSIMILEENQSEKRPSPFNSPLHEFLEGISASTPKCDRSIAKAIFPPQLTNSGNRSNASRRSLINRVVDEVEDIGEIMGTTDEDDDSNEEKDDLVEEEAEECSGESAEPEEEPAGETLDTVEESFHLDCMLSEKSEADETESSQEESTGDAELQSGEQIDYFTQESVSEKEARQSSSPTVGNYNTLVDSGKKLKDDGKLQEALNCFLQALDIKSGDPEVMLMTLNLYRQLAQK
ncbi:PREDICTED: DNA excision repair protein ERCC-6-like [Haliaeetus leucocephalus]|uniref:DNA excision repair protein ERCC-6-like n=1 Tax=Haliaeetus leucocephalus TaxID=52644 RepID=UPI00053CE582|nr:PREDICTED: DNA excision repair protein ERCC-6-like [Haliaeetus leucocephalus]